MVCGQVKIYVTYLVINILIGVTVQGSNFRVENLFGALVGLVIINELCNYECYTLANVLVSIAIVLSIIIDVYYFTHKDTSKHGLYAEILDRDRVI